MSGVWLSSVPSAGPQHSEPRVVPQIPAAFLPYPDRGDQIHILREQLGLMFAGDTRAEQNWKELVISFTSELTV